MTPTNKYHQMCSILKKIQPKIPKDQREKDHLLAKLSYLLFDIAYFEGNQKFQNFDEILNNRNSGELIWYLLYLCSKGIDKKILSFANSLETELTQTEDNLLYFEYLYLKFYLLINQHNFDQVLAEFLEKRQKILNLPEKMHYIKGLLYSSVLSIIPFLQKTEILHEIINESKKILNFQLDAFTFALIKRDLLRINFLEPKLVNENRQKLNEILNIYKKIDSKLMIMKIHMDLGILEFYNGNLSKSVINFEKARLMAYKLNANWYNAYISFLYGLTLNKMGNYQKSEQVYLKTIELYTSLNNEVQIINVYDDLANLYVELGEFKDAEKYFQMAINLAKKNSIKPLIVGSSLNLAELKLSQGDFGQVQNLINTADQVIENTIEDNHTMGIFSLKAQMFNLQGKYHEALQILEDGENQLEQNFPAEVISSFNLQNSEIR